MTEQKPDVPLDYTMNCFIEGCSTISVDYLLQAMEVAGPTSTCLDDHEITMHPTVLRRMRRASLLDPVDRRETFMGRKVTVLDSAETVDASRRGVFCTIVTGPICRALLYTREY